MRHARDLALGALIGAGLMFLLDPRGGSARRALVRQKSVRAVHEIETAVGIGKRDLGHRVQGIASMAFGKRRPAHAPPDVIVARVRSKLGRLTSHPHAVKVESKGDGAIVLKGPILRAELDRVLSGLSHVRGVHEIESELEVHDRPDIPALQGGSDKPTPRPLHTPASRFVLGIAAASFAVTSFLKGHPLGALAGGALAFALAHSIVHRGGEPSLGHGGLKGLRESYPPGSEWAPASE